MAKRVWDTVERACDTAGRASDTAGRARDTAGRARYTAGRARDMAGLGLRHGASAHNEMELHGRPSAQPRPWVCALCT